jgi:NAD(P)H-dependent flavin oxidoreductase YrpB (nitropropane dioxygenase family)
MIQATAGLTNRAFNVNLFCHQPPARDDAGDARWIEALRSEFEKFGAKPPNALREIYQSFVTDQAMLQMLLETRPKVVSFHFGLPSAAAIKALKDAGIILLHRPPISRKPSRGGMPASMRWWRKAMQRAAIAEYSIPMRRTPNSACSRSPRFWWTGLELP